MSNREASYIEHDDNSTTKVQQRLDQLASKCGKFAYLDQVLFYCRKGSQLSRQFSLPFAQRHYPYGPQVLRMAVQPTDADLAQISGRHLLKVEVALDICHRDRQVIRELRDLVEKHLIWVRPGRLPSYSTQYPRRVGGADGTIYQAPRGARLNLVVYSDRVSKLTGLPCLHMEVRIRGRRFIERQGVTNVSQCDLVAYLKKNIRLGVMREDGVRQIGHAWIKAHGGKKPEGIGCVILRSVQGETVQEVISGIRKRRIARLEMGDWLRQLDTGSLFDGVETGIKSWGGMELMRRRGRCGVRGGGVNGHMIMAGQT